MVESMIVFVFLKMVVVMLDILVWVGIGVVIMDFSIWVVMMIGLFVLW